MSFSGHIIRVELWWQDEEGNMTLERRANGILEEIGDNANRNFEDVVRWGRLFEDSEFKLKGEENEM